MDLAKLLPWEKILHDDGSLSMYEKDGISYLQPVVNKTQPTISDLRKWQQAFELYATIYTERHPDRSVELFRYIYNIRAAAVTYVWDNVYLYDVVFRRLMERNPGINWGFIYQQGWDLMLKEKIANTVTNQVPT